MWSLGDSRRSPDQEFFGRRSCHRRTPSAVPGPPNQLTRLLRNRYPVTFAILLTSAASCANFDTLASQVAHGQEAGSQAIRREGALAPALCRSKAEFTYLATTLRLNPALPEPRPEPFAEWYVQAIAMVGPHGVQVPWASYCAGFDRAGDLYNLGVVALAGYAASVQSLTDAKAFDASSLSTVGADVGSLSTSFQAPPAVSSAATDIGSAASSLTGPVVTYWRTRELKKLLTNSHGAVTKVLKSLDAYLGALDIERALVVHDRQIVVEAMSVGRVADAGFTAASEGALAFDLATDAARNLERFERHIASDRTLIAAIVSAEDTLVTAASGGSDKPAKSAAADLSTLISALNCARPEEP